MPVTLGSSAAKLVRPCRSSVEAAPKVVPSKLRTCSVPFDQPVKSLPSTMKAPRLLLQSWPPPPTTEDEVVPVVVRSRRTTPSSVPGGLAPRLNVWPGRLPVLSGGIGCAARQAA